jgi:mono/diheme cytochrome c family protein
MLAHPRFAVALLLLLTACAPAVPITPTLNVRVTEAPRVLTIAPAPETPMPGRFDPQRVAQGQTRYQTLECSVCHGLNGRGTSRGPALVGMSLGEQDFMNILRSGGKLGANHVYSTSRLSNEDGNSLYIYILSFSGGG